MKKIDAQHIICETLIAVLNEDVEEEGTDGRLIEFNRGIQAGLKAKTYGGKFIMTPDQLKNHYPPAFVKGYKKGMGESWWDNFNNKLTHYAGRFGYSRTR